MRPLAPRTARPRRARSADDEPLTLAQSINTTLAHVLEERPHAIAFGQDVAVKGGVYGVTRGLRKRFGGRRVFDTLLDEQTILGTALGSALAGLLPIPEIQYLAYLHNAEDQLRGEAASLAFFSDGHYRNPVVVRIAGLAYQQGFGGHFHNDSSLAVLRDVPGLVLSVPSHPADAPLLLRECVELAEVEGRVCVVVEPIALYHSRDLHEPGDGRWTAPYEIHRPGRRGPRAHGDGADLLVVTFGNGVPMTLRARGRPGSTPRVLDLRWLSPLPADELAAYAAGFDAVLVVDETRRSGGVGEGIVATLVDRGYDGRLARVAGADSYVPLGPASRLVLVTEEEIEEAALELIAASTPVSTLLAAGACPGGDLRHVRAGVGGPRGRRMRCSSSSPPTRGPRSGHSSGRSSRCSRCGASSGCRRRVGRPFCSRGRTAVWAQRRRRSRRCGRP